MEILLYASIGGLLIFWTLVGAHYAFAKQKRWNEENEKYIKSLQTLNNMEKMYGSDVFTMKF